MKIIVDMGTFLFDKIIFGPIKSRRLGISLGINLLPMDKKVCTYDCIYCECGWLDRSRKGSGLPSREEVADKLSAMLIDMDRKKELPDVITFAGNGEPTLHPKFEEIIDDTILLRDRYCPEAKVAVLTNSTTVNRESVFRALKRVDDNLLKFDSAVDETYRLLDMPQGDIDVDTVVDNLSKFNGDCTIQTMFVSGSFNGKQIDNSTEEEVELWIKALKKISPKMVMIYTIDRDTPAKDLHKISLDRLNEIAAVVEKEIGAKTSVSG